MSGLVSHLPNNKLDRATGIASTQYGVDLNSMPCYLTGGVVDGTKTKAAHNRLGQIVACRDLIQWKTASCSHGTQYIAH